MKSYNARTGKISIVYSKGRKDFKKASGLWNFKPNFSGPYEVVFSGSRASKDELFTVVCMKGVRGIRISAGSDTTLTSWFRPSINSYEGRASSNFDLKDSSPIVWKKKFSFGVKVGEKFISVRCNGKTLFEKMPRSDWEWGRMAFGAKAPIQEIEIKGFVERSWITGLRDRWTESKRGDFERTFVMSQHAPEWLMKGPTAKAKSEAAAEIKYYPDTLNNVQLSLSNKIYSLSRNEQSDEAIDILTERGAKELPEATAEYLYALIFGLMKFHQKALVHSGRMIELATDFYYGRVFHLRLLQKVGPMEAAKAEWTKLFAKYPFESEFFGHTVRLRIDKGDFEGAKEILAKVRARVGSDKDWLKSLDSWDEHLFFAERGPDWPRVFEHKTVHYRVTSDIDRKTCVAAGKILEEALRAYSRDLVRPESEKNRRYRVFIFSGKDSYLRYSESVGAGTSHSTAGLYLPNLNQLLIWNLPLRESMLKTVRHEGFHQYLDMVAPHSPTWFNEGTAEYFEATGGRKWNTGERRKDHLRLLAQKGVMDLDRFLYIPPLDFYRLAPHSYAQAWLMVHLLRHGPQEMKAIHERLFKAMQTGDSGNEAVRSAFKGVDLKALTKQLKEHFKKLNDQE